MSLSDAEINAFEENGYLLKRGLVSAALLRRMRGDTENIHDRMAMDPPDGVHISWEDLGPDHPKRIQQLMNSELVCPSIDEFLRSDLVLDILEDLIGPDIALYHSKLLPKCAGNGRPIPWHQDYAYWQRENNRPLMINCQFAIVPSTKENGCIEFVPGSHKSGLRRHERRRESFGVFLAGHYQDRDDSVPIEMDPGNAVFFGPLVVHGSAANRSNQDRMMNTCAYNVTDNGVRENREILRRRS